jgi:bloom syndrome protein
MRTDNCGLVTPEKLCTKEFMELLTKVYEQDELNRLVVDEVSHHFSQRSYYLPPHRLIVYQ